MPPNSNYLRKKSAVLELITDKQLADLRKSSDLLFTGQVVSKSEGGFKKHYDLPTPALIDRCASKYDSMADVLSVRIKNHTWLYNRTSNWTKNMCILFASQGLLFVYIKPNRGYVLKLSYALKMKAVCGRKTILPYSKQMDNCRMKFKFEFGSIEFRLTRAQTENWLRPMINAFDGKFPCFERYEEEIKSHISTEKVDTQSTKSSPKVEVASSDSSFGVASLFKTPTGRLSTCSEATTQFSTPSPTRGDLYDDYMAIKHFLAPLKDIDSEVSMYPESEASKEEIEADANSNDHDSGAELEVVKKDENNFAFYPTPITRKSKKSVTFGIPQIDLITRTPKTISPTAKSVTNKTSPGLCKMNTTFNLPVYRLETEREKLSRREPQTRIAEKIRYFEEINQTRNLPEKWNATFD